MFSTLEVGVVFTACKEEVEEERVKLVWEAGVACFGLNTWKALVPAPRLFREENGSAEEGEVRGEAIGANPPTTSDAIISGELPSVLLTPAGD